MSQETSRKIISSFEKFTQMANLFKNLSVAIVPKIIVENEEITESFLHHETPNFWANLVWTDFFFLECFSEILNSFFYWLIHDFPFFIKSKMFNEKDYSDLKLIVKTPPAFFSNAYSPSSPSTSKTPACFPVQSVENFGTLVQSPENSGTPDNEEYYLWVFIFLFRFFFGTSYSNQSCFLGRLIQNRFQKQSFAATAIFSINSLKTKKLMLKKQKQVLCSFFQIDVISMKIWHFFSSKNDMNNSLQNCWLPTSPSSKTAVDTDARKEEKARLGKKLLQLELGDVDFQSLGFDKNTFCEIDLKACSFVLPEENFHMFKRMIWYCYRLVSFFSFSLFYSCWI